MPPIFGEQYANVGVSKLTKALVTGGAGFIGSNVVDKLISLGQEVVIFDNFSTGRDSFLNPAAEVVSGSLTGNLIDLKRALVGVSVVYHLAANADVRDGWSHTSLDLEQNVIATCLLLQACVDAGVEEFVFSSTGSVYGESEIFPTPENAPFPIQTSLYGASKASAESFIQAYASAGKIKATVFRFVSVLGPRYTHGHVIDFTRQLEKDKSRLTVLGNGHQRKSYMHVDDCVNAVVSLRATDGFSLFNLGSNTFCTVRESINWICDELGLQPEITYGESDRGWIGDNPFIWLDVSKANSSGWKAQTSIEESVRHTVRWLKENPDVLIETSH